MKQKSNLLHTALRAMTLPQSVSRAISVGWLLLMVGLLGTACTRPEQVQATITRQQPVETVTAPATSQQPLETTTRAIPQPPATITRTATPPLVPMTETAVRPTATATPPTIEDTLSTVGYGLPLTIRHVTETEAVLFFKLDAPAAGRLFYWPAAASEQLSWLPFPATASRQQISLTGLTPGTEYQAVVGLEAENGRYQPPHFQEQAWGVVSFQTASGDWPLRVGVLGDSGLGETATLELAQQMATQELDFVLHTGDLVYLMQQNASPFEAYALKYYTTLAPLLHEIPLYPTVGNHDIESAAIWQDAPFYYYVFPSFDSAIFDPTDIQTHNQWYSVAYGPVQFLMLDTQTLFGEVGGDAQDAWLAERLADDRFNYTIPVFHVPLYASGQRHEENLVVQRAWAALFQAANVPLTFSGHEHFYERLEVAGLTQIISGGGSTVLYPIDDPLPESQALVREMHFVLLELYTDRIELSAINREGRLLDQLTILLTGSVSTAQ